MHTCIFNRSGLLKCWGANYNGQLGLGDTNSRGDEKNEMGFNLPFVKVGDSLKVDQVSIGLFHTCVHVNDNQVKCWGQNVYGQLGLGINNNQIADTPETTPDHYNFIDFGTQSYPTVVISGAYFTCSLMENKKVKCFGMYESGSGEYDVPKAYGLTSTDMGDNLPFVELGANILAESVHGNALAEYACVILASSQLIKCWGENSSGNLGYGDLTDRYISNKILMGDNLPTVDLGDEDRVKQIALGGGFTCALRIDDEIKCWGFNSRGQLGIGLKNEAVYIMGNNLLSTPYDGGRKIKQIAAGYTHTCILYDDSVTLKCIGNFGTASIETISKDSDLISTTFSNTSVIDLGTGNLQIAYVAANFQNTCIRFVDNSVKCFGDNEYGYLGYGNKDNIADELYKLGLNLPFVDVFQPTKAPTNVPTVAPTYTPSLKPISKPTSDPTISSPSTSTSTTLSPTTLNPTNKPATKTPSTMNSTPPSNSFGSYPTKKKCKKDKSCKWKRKKCSVLYCTKYLNRPECIADVRCDWKKGVCRLEPK